VYLDAPALGRLNELGYADLTGFSVAGLREVDCLEAFTDDPLNLEFAGRQRDGRQSFWPSAAALLEPTAEAARLLAAW